MQTEKYLHMPLRRALTILDHRSPLSLPVSNRQVQLLVTVPDTCDRGVRSALN